MDVECELKLEHDKLEYEISQEEKIQDNIDKLHVKICDLKKHKEGECAKTKSKHKLKHKLSKTQLYSGPRIASTQ